MNKAMQKLLGTSDPLSMPLADGYESVTQVLRGEEFAENGDIVTFEGYKQSTLQSSPEDPTGLECLLNKWHSDDFYKEPKPTLFEVTTAGISFAFALKDKLTQSGIKRRFRIVVSSSSNEELPPTCTVRFHVLREKHAWLKENLDSYKNEALLIIDWMN